MEFLYSKLQAFKLQPLVLPCTFLKFWKISEITFAVKFLFIEAGSQRFSTEQLKKFCFNPKKLIGKDQGRPRSVLKKNSTLDILLARNFRSSCFFKTPMDECFRQFKQLFSRTPMETFGWTNRKLQRNKYLQQSRTDAIIKHRKEHKYSTLLKKFLKAKAIFFHQPC